MRTKAQHTAKPGNSHAFTKSNHSGATFFSNTDQFIGVQTKLSIGKPGDKYEVEADRAADAIVAKKNDSPAPFFAPNPLVQKQSQEENDTAIQEKPLVETITPVVQLQPEILQTQAEEESEVQLELEEDVQTKGEEEQLQAMPQEEESIQQKVAEDEIQTQVEEEPVQALIQKEESEEEVQAKCEDCEQEEQVQRQEEEEPLQMQVEEEPVQEKVREEEPVQTLLQKQEEEDQVQAKEETLQKQESEAPEVQQEIQPKPESELQSKEIVAPEPIVPSIQKQATEEVIQEKEEEEQEDTIQQKSVIQKIADPNEQEATTVQTKSEPNAAPASIESQLNTSKGGGAPLPDGTKQQMESGFGADFSSVRVHTDSTAVQMSKGLGAQAFTHGSDIYFNEGKYDTSSDSGQHLLAHELTHTVQQGAAVQTKMEVSKSPEQIQRLPSIVANRLNEYARFIPGYTLFTLIIGFNPILGRSVTPTATNLVEAVLELVPIWGVLLVNKLREYNIIEDAFDWISGQLSSLDITTNRIERLIDEAWERMDFIRWDPFDYNLGVLTDTFEGLYNNVVTFADNLKDHILEMIKEAVVEPLVGFLEENSPTYVLATKVIGRKFPLEEEVNAPTVEILEEFLILIGKQTEVEEMRNKGTLQETADWIDTQLGTFYSLLDRFSALFTRAWDAFSLENLHNIPAIFSGLLTDFGDLLQDFLDFALVVAAKVLEIIKNALLQWLNSFAADIPGFTLLTVIIAKNPLTGEDVPRTTVNIIRGFMGLVPGGEAKFQELQQTGVVTNAAARIDALITRLDISLAFIVGLFTDLWNSFTIDDLLNPIPAFQRITDAFGEPIRRLFEFVVEVIKILIELILQMMNIPPEMVGNIIANAMSAFEDIKNDPIGFLLNLMNAIKTGFMQFLGNIGTHLLNGLQNWLFGTLADAGIQMPADLSLQSILGLAMDVLGITVDNILERLALKIGQERVDQIRAVLDTLTGIWTFIKDVMERGPIAIWEYVQEKLNNLWDIIKDGIMGYIQEKVIQQAIGWLLSFLDVTGIMPIIRGVQTAFNAVMSFIEKLPEIIAIINSFVQGVADIARGSIQTAANFLEIALADGIPVAISFLAKQLGLGDISQKIQEMIEAARGKINEGIDWLIDKAMSMGRSILNALGLGGGDSEEEPPEGENNLNAEQAIEQITNRITQNVVPRLNGKNNVQTGAIMESVHQEETRWLEQNLDKTPYNGATPELLLIPKEDENSWWIEVKFNPITNIPKQDKGTGGTGWDQGTEYVGMFHGTNNNTEITSALEIDMSLLTGREEDGTGLELGSGLYLTHFYIDAKGYAPANSKNDDSNNGYIYHIGVPKDLLLSASHPQTPDTRAGDEHWASKGEVVKGQWKIIGSNGWKAGYQWVIKSEEAVRRLRIIRAYKPLEAADQLGRGRRQEFPTLYGGGSAGDVRRYQNQLVAAGQRHRFGESPSIQETGVGAD
ncbi:DUF4157 domain-containing protein [Sungkyunkwania multivorans]|uniref:DUF4157 domain-containing protein n=1 Tax=Sungkyunkwania multivorans TaxID=1173618 RepID=A0ABW3CXU2_9FLAO